MRLSLQVMGDRRTNRLASSCANPSKIANNIFYPPSLPSLRYRCGECGKNYATSSNLSRHKQVRYLHQNQLCFWHPPNCRRTERWTRTMPKSATCAARCTWACRPCPCTFWHTTSHTSAGRWHMYIKAGISISLSWRILQEGTQQGLRKSLLPTLAAPRTPTIAHWGQTLWMRTLRKVLCR